jgi:hypothetical protein
MNINWRFVLSKLWKAALMGLLIAVGIALWPQAQCAVAQTCDAPRDRWCGSGQCCGQTAGFDAVVGCQKSGSSCLEKMDRGIPARCENQGDCLVTWVGRRSDRLSKEYVPGRGWVTYWYVGKCEWSTCSLNSTANKQEVSCCGGGGGGCTPQYAPPTIEDGYTVDPPNPIVWSQEQPPYGLALGMTINDIKAHGGVDTTCGTGQRANITSMTINLTLTEKTLNWIFGELAQRYINVHLKGTYPQYPEVADFGHAYSICSTGTGLIGYNTPDAELDCRFFRPRDPGEYAIHVTACQSDGQCTTKTLPEPVKVWLMETVLSGAWR